MAYDPATGNVVLFGGATRYHTLAQTWVWNGTTWAQQHPATSPAAAQGTSMAYDAATGNLVLFGGATLRDKLRQATWAWDGTTWTNRHKGRHAGAVLAGKRAGAGLQRARRARWSRRGWRRDSRIRREPAVPASRVPARHGPWETGGPLDD
jgi:hypothetical protein